jgi:UDP-2,3-diacylglucosamine pyrophosphatase LpxH
MPPDQVHEDRRDFMKAVGVAAVGTAVGASATASAATDYSHVVCASDSHLGAPKANDDAFLQFVNDDLPSIAPDLFVLNGDVVEMWTRGISSSLLQYNDFTTHLEDLEASGIDVVLTAGNHDWRLLEVGRSDYDAATLSSPWGVVSEFQFTSGGREFVAVHGHQGDPLQEQPMMELLCLGSDDFGKAIWDFYQDKNNWSDAKSGLVGEVGALSVSADGGSFESASFTNSLDDPVVVTSPASYDGSQPVHPRVRSVSGSGFEVTLEEWQYLDGGHVTEDVYYLGLAVGTHTLPDGTTVEVGRVKTDHTWSSVELTAGFDATPAVFTESQTYNTNNLAGGSEPIVTRTRNAGPGGFEVRVQEEEAGDDHATETIGYVAVEPGTGTNDGTPFEAGVTPDTVTDDTHTVWFDTDFASAPACVADLQSYDGPDPAALRFTYLDQYGVDLFVEEEASSDDETSHTSERVSYLAFESTGGVYSAHTTTHSNWWDWVTQDAYDAWDGFTSDSDIISDVVTGDPSMMAGLESKGAATDGVVTSNLLDQYSRYVVFGHTHVPDKGDRYVNSGAWTDRGGASLDGSDSETNTFVEIVDGDVSVKSWSSTGTTTLY